MLSSIRRTIATIACGLLLFGSVLLILSSPAAADMDAQKRAAALFLQDFDTLNAGLPYTSAIHAPPPPAGPVRMAGGPTGQGHFMRLAFGSPIPNHSSIGFERGALGAHDQVVIDFDFRMTPATGRADGLGFAFLNTANFGPSGPAEPQAPHFAAEEPNFAGSVGIGFDIHKATDGRPEVSNNHLSLHFNGAQVQDFDAAPFDLAAGEWLHARVVLNAGGGAVSVILSACGAEPVAVIDNMAVPGLAAYEGRAYFVARSGGESADHDIDNVSIQLLSQGENAAAVATPCAAEIFTYNNFDEPNVGTPFVLETLLPPPALGPTYTVGGPSGIGHHLRLAYGAGEQSHNAIAFDRTNSGAYAQVVADFALRIQPGTGRADGLGFALLNTANYGASGEAALSDVAEEPNFAGSLGVGFDIYQSNAGHLETNDNHVSIHYNGVMLKEVDVRNAVDLAEGQWIHARIIMRPAAPYGDISVILTQCGQPARTVVDRFKVPGLAPYEGRALFAARAGGLKADHDIDDVRVYFLHGEQSLVSFATGCHEVVESAGAAQLTVTRVGNLNAAVAVNYTTTENGAMAGADFTPSAGTLTFAPGENSKTIAIPILDDAIDDERDERLAVFLATGQGAALLGEPHAANVKIIDDELARREGYWHDLIPSQVVPIHAQLLPTGKIMYWDRHDAELGWDGNPRLFDPATNEITVTAPIAYDIFCSGYAFLENGHMLVAGGHITGSFGEDKMSIYDPFTNEWTPQPAMNHGRWYPTAVTLANGDVLVMGGTFDLNGAVAVNTIPQVWDASQKEWRTLTNAKHDSQPDNPNFFPTDGGYPDHPNYYPFLYVTAHDEVFNAGPQRMARYLNTAGLGQWRDLAPSLLEYRDYGSSVMYDAGKVLITGGNPRDPQVDVNPTILPSASTQVIDLNAAAPVWRDVGNLNFGRRHLNTTLLPDGRVFANGGSSAAGFDEESGAVLAAEMWDPTSAMWSTMAAQKRYRGYHSIALLLPDGRILSGGGGHPNPRRGAQHNFEIYAPPYLFKGARPEITSAPAQVTYGQQFAVQSPSGAQIANVTWVRLSAVTHAFNQSQRINHLAFAPTTMGLTVTAPASADLAPPGHYMLFILNRDGVPSVAKMVQLVNELTTPTPTHTPTPTASKTPVPKSTPETTLFLPALSKP